MRPIILLNFVFLAFSFQSNAQASIDLVFGEITYVSTGNGEVVFSVSLPAIEMVKNDTEGVITLGIPPVFSEPVSTGISRPSMIAGISAYPNPVSDYIIIERETIQDDYHVSLLSFDGKLILESKWTSEQPTISIRTADLPSGAYVVALKDTKTGALGRVAFTK